MCQGQILVPLLQALQTNQAIPLSPICRLQFHPGSLVAGPESVSSHKLRAAVSVGSLVMILNSFADITPPLSLQLDSWGLAECLTVDLCISFHQLLDEGLCLYFCVSPLFKQTA